MLHLYICFDTSPMGNYGSDSSGLRDTVPLKLISTLNEKQQISLNTKFNIKHSLSLF